MNYAIATNSQYNSLEVSFSEKPVEAVRDALKGLKFRWNGKKSVWYGYASEQEARAAIDGAGADNTAQEPEKPVKKAEKKAVRYDLSGLENNKKTAYGAEFAAVLRQELKRRGVSGFSIRSNRSGWTDSYTITVKMQPEDFRSAEEAAARDGWRQFFNRQESRITVDGVEYSRWNVGREDDTHKYIGCGAAWDDKTPGSNAGVQRAYFMQEIANFRGVNVHHMRREDNPELSAAGFDRLSALVRIVQSYNYDNSDPMSDYYDVGFYLDIDAKMPDGFQPREVMTDAERVQLVKDQEAEAEAERQRFEEAERERERQRAEAERRAAQAELDRAEVLAAVTVEDLAEGRRFFVTGLCGGIGKDCTIGEAMKSKDRPAPDALISRRVTFSNAAALEKFSNMLLHDWEFLAGKGGTGTNDPRVNDENIWKLNREQREAVTFYSVDSIAVYLGDVLQFVVNPEGYNYARYVYLLTDEARELSAEESADRIKAEESAQVQPFYFPAPVEDQAAEIAARLLPGDTITAYQLDGMLLSVRMTTGEFESVEPGTYAQYKGVYITIVRNRKRERLFFTDSKQSVIVAGLPSITPADVAWKRTWSSGGAVLKESRDYDEQMRMIAEHCKGMAILDTVQR